MNAIITAAMITRRQIKSAFPCYKTLKLIQPHEQPPVQKKCGSLSCGITALELVRFFRIYSQARQDMNPVVLIQETLRLRASGPVPPEM